MLFYLLNLSHELRPRTRYNEQYQISIEAVHYSADFNHRIFGAVAGLCESMDGACAFFMPISIVFPPTETEVRVIITIIKNNLITWKL